ncbi:MAG: HNH endonuclease [Burkholderiales bacterium]|jgi:hypothetical protein
MGKSLRHARFIAAQRQSNRCYYCNVPMWEDLPPTNFLQFTKSPKQTNRLRCTGEHLRARADGGHKAAGNIVAACAFCNRTRHRAKRPLDPDAYRQRVGLRMSKGRWHPEWVHRFLAGSTFGGMIR